ncbi:hypothetical protein [Sphingorhabdus sp. Alg231-15]|uniref:hypothetical protein n=1 Tax=Sphingorhabdus sp. Alg231-15 TaxID=1922222 RepID=UPI00307B2397
MTGKKLSNELNVEELDQVSGGVHGSAAMNSGIVKTAKPGSKIHGTAQPNSGVRAKRVVAEGGGSGI